MNAPAIWHSVRVRRASPDLAGRAAAVAVPAVLVVGVLAWPLYLSSSSFAGSWIQHMWFMWKQSQTILSGHFPSLFLNYSHGVFYPDYAFYGGTLYALTGALSIALGNAPIVAYVSTYLLAFAAAYGGWYWLGRQAGLGRWQSQAPGLVFVTSSYYLTMIYADGDWGEFMAVSMIPLMVAAGLGVVRAGRLRLWPALALTLGGVVFFGSHTLTLVWGSTVIAVVGAAVLVCVPGARRLLTRGGLVRVGALLAGALLVSAWFLIPAAIYQSNTWIASQGPGARELVRSTMYLVAVRHLFTISRATAATPQPDFVLSLPVLAIVWALVGVGLAWRARLGDPWRRFLLVCATATTALIVLMTHAGLILALPRYYAALQYSYRLESYVLLCLSATMLAVLVLARSEAGHLRSWTRWALPPILAVGAIGAVQQVAAYPTTTNRNVEAAGFYTEGRAPPSTSAAGVFKDYIDVHQPVMNGEGSGRSNAPGASQSILSGTGLREPILRGSFERLGMLDFDNLTPQGERVSARVQLHAGELVDTNLFGPPYLVRVTGARIVGINAVSGADILEVGARSPASGARDAPAPGAGDAPASGANDAPASGAGDTPAQTATISVAPSSSFPVVLGRVLSTCAATALALVLALLAAGGCGRAAVRLRGRLRGQASAAGHTMR
jgi:hypothetical protein